MRSFLFVPVLEDRFIRKAPSQGADAVVLDLEASIAAERKDQARAALPGAVALLAPQMPVTVRINPLWLAAIDDLHASVIDGVSMLHLALCESAEHLRAVDAMVTELEIARGLPPGGITLIAMLESALAVSRATEIAHASPRLAGLTLGVEDYATSMGVAATPDLLRPAVQQVIQAARSANLPAYAVPASMADFRDLDGLRDAAHLARRMGSVGCYAVHPGQVAVLNEVFGTTEQERDWARRVLSGAEKARQQGLGVFQVDGQMIDQPLIDRARHMLAREKT